MGDPPKIEWFNDFHGSGANYSRFYKADFLVIMPEKHVVFSGD
jgi:hypothetical protein